MISPDEVPLLPGEVKPHPSPFQYVMIVVVLCVITAVEVGLYYLEGDIPTGPDRLAAARHGAREVHHGRELLHAPAARDKPIFRRFFITGGVGAVILYTIVLTTLHIWD